MRIKIITVLLLCLLLMQSCNLSIHITTGSETPEYTWIRYSSPEEIRELFFDNKSKFTEISTLLYDDRRIFFDINDNCILAAKKYDYSNHFTQEEWQSVMVFLKETGVLGISFDVITAKYDWGRERSVFRLRYSFIAIDEKVRCSLISLSTPVDAEFERHMLNQYLNLHQYLGNDIEIEKLCDGWYFLTIVSK